MNRTKYSEEFMEQAVRRTLTGSFTIKEVAESLGITYYTLREWRRKYLKNMENEQPKNDKELLDAEEFKRILKENKRLKEENAILKKFAAMLSKEQYPDLDL